VRDDCEQRSGLEICGHGDIGCMGDCGVPDVRRGTASGSDEQENEISKEVDSGISMIVKASVLGVSVIIVIRGVDIGLSVSVQVT